MSPNLSKMTSSRIMCTEVNHSNRITILIAKAISFFKELAKSFNKAAASQKSFFQHLKLAARMSFSKYHLALMLFLHE